MLTDLETVRWLGPEIALILAATFIAVGGAFRAAPRFWLSFTVAAYGAAAGLLLYGERIAWSSEIPPLFTGPLVVDELGHVLRFLAITAGILLSFTLTRSPQQPLQTEILSLTMFTIVGAMLTARANELVLLMLGLELVSIPTYALLFIGRRGRATGESAAKYFYLSVLSSALLLYGFSFLYGVAGTTWLQSMGDSRSIRAALEATSGPWALLGLGFVMAGLGFKIAAAPFHFYAPDVYQGTSNANAALLSVVPKVAGFAAMTRLVVMVLGPGSEVVWQLVLVLAIVTMTVGNVCALWQQNVRRMMAYSSIAHAGYMLIGIAVASTPQSIELSFGGTAAMLFYLCAYAIGALGFFAALASLSRGEESIDTVEQLAGLGGQRPLLAAIMAVCLFSLAGIPPLTGFWGKLTLFSSALGIGLQSDVGDASFWFLTLAVMGALNAAVAAAYYLRIISAMYFRKPLSRGTQTHFPTSTSLVPLPSARWWNAPQVAAAICATLLLVLGIYQSPLSDAASRAEKGLQGRGRMTGEEVVTASLPREDRDSVSRIE